MNMNGGVAITPGVKNDPLGLKNDFPSLSEI